MTLPGLSTLKWRHFLYVALAFVVLAVVMAVVYSPMLGGYWCRHFEMPEYERQFGFTLGTFELPHRSGGTYLATGITKVDPSGAFARAGIRPGDIPRMHHGIWSLCSALGAATEGYQSTLSVINVDDLRARRDARREVTLSPGIQ